MPAKEKDLAVILVHYHTPSLLRAAIDALQSEIRENSLNAEIIVVDNGSSEADKKQFEKLPAKYIRCERNLGYAGGINRGAVFTVAKNMVFMNPDVIVAPGCLSLLLAELQKGSHAAGPRLFWDREHRYMLPPTEQRSRWTRLLRTLAHRGGLSKKLARSHWRKHAHRHWCARKPIQSYSLSGALLAVTREAWNSIGPMDESFQLYFEENDWLMRLKQAGLKASYVPEAKAHHSYNQSAKNEALASDWFAQSEQRFEQRYYGPRFCALMGWIHAHLNKPEISETLSVERSIPSLECKRPGLSPKWFEFSALPLGFPATSCRIPQESAHLPWHVEDELYQGLSDGHWEIRFISKNGKEFLNTRFSKRESSFASKPENDGQQAYEQRRTSPLS